MIILKDKNTYILKLKREEYVVKTLESFAIKEKIKSASFTAIGALDEAELAHYNVEKKKYSSKKFNAELELVSMTGNIAWHEGKPLVHTHATLSNPKMNVIGGHFVEGRVSGTCEIHLTTYNKKIEKEFDLETGLKVMK